MRWRKRPQRMAWSVMTCQNRLLITPPQCPESSGNKRRKMNRIYFDQLRHIEQYEIFANLMAGNLVFRSRQPPE